MADTSELKHMIMSFRVSELQVLLGFAGRNKSGRKQELLQRALQLVQKGCTMPVQIKIRELARQIHSSTIHRKRYPGAPGGFPTQVQAQADVQPQPPGLGSCYGSYASDPAGPIDFSNKHMPTAHPEPTPSGLPVHPDVRFKHLPFYDVLGELMKPTSLVPKNNGRFQESFFIFHLTPQQAQDIAMSRDFRPGAKCEYTVQVQLRFCLLETSCEQDDNFPPSICVRVNGKMASLPIINNKSKPGVARPLDITFLTTLKSHVGQELHLTWSVENETGVGYCLAIYLVRRLTSDILLQRLRQFGNRHSDHTRALIKEKLAHDPDSEIATTSLRVSLLCPLGKMRMQIPCRSSTCNHLQCFDATTFLMMNEKKPSWICPVCDKQAPFDKLLIDGYFVEIFRKSPECDEIQFHEDGTWSPMNQKKETHLISSPAVKTSHSNNSSSSSSISIHAPSTSSSAGSDKAPPKKSVQVIDLTLDSSDDEDPCSPASVSSSRPSEQGCRTPTVSPALSNISTPNNFGSPALGSPRMQSPRVQSPRTGHRSPRPLLSPRQSTTHSPRQLASPASDSSSQPSPNRVLPCSNGSNPNTPRTNSIPNDRHGMNSPGSPQSRNSPFSMSPNGLRTSPSQARSPVYHGAFDRPYETSPNFANRSHKRPLADNLSELRGPNRHELVRGFNEPSQAKRVCSTATSNTRNFNRSTVQDTRLPKKGVSMNDLYKSTSPNDALSPLDQLYAMQSADRLGMANPYHIKSPNHIGPPLDSPVEYTSHTSPPVSPYYSRSPRPVGSPAEFAYNMKSPVGNRTFARTSYNIKSPTQQSPKSFMESQMRSPVYSSSMERFHFPNILKREYPLSSSPVKRLSPGPRYSHPVTSKMHPAFSTPLSSMMTSPFSVMAPSSSWPNLSHPRSTSYAANASLTPGLGRNGVSSASVFNVPSFDDDLLPILTSNDEIPDFISQSPSMLNIPPSSTSSSQHLFNLHKNVVSLD